MEIHKFNKLNSNKSSYDSTKKVDTKTITYNMYISGKSITEIANIRGFTKQTIEHHLLNCLESGMEINLEKCVQMQYKDEIYRAIDELGYSKLKPLKESLPGNITYFDIGYFVVLYKLDKSKNSLNII